MKFILVIACFLSGFSLQAKELISSDYNWAGLFIVGDNEIPNFDNGRNAIARKFSQMGMPRDQQIHFSLSPSELAKEDVYVPSFDNLKAGFHEIKAVEDSDACLVHMTSHGIKRGGFYVKGFTNITPNILNKFLDDNCGDQPTVLLVSACFSGQFINWKLKGKNRIILTAAKKSLPSFGCHPDRRFTFWDGCLTKLLRTAETWKGLHEDIKVCIQEKEAKLDAPDSFPQAFFGKNVENMRILHK